MQNVETMQLTAEVFQETLRHQLQNYEGQTAHDKLIKFVAHIVLVEKPYLMTTSEGLPHLIDLVFRDPDIADFVLGLTFSFYARMAGDEGGKYHAFLCSVLADSVGYGALRGRPICAIPGEIALRLADSQQTQQLLNDNRWIVVLLLMQLFVSLSDAVKEK